MQALIEALLMVVFLQPALSLVSEFEKISQKAQGRVGAAILLLETGETAGVRIAEKFSMQSVFKLPIAMTVMHRVDQGKISLEQKILIRKSDFSPRETVSQIRDQHPEGNFEITVRELLRVMMDLSDGTACDVLLGLSGGPAAVTEYVHSLGAKEMGIAISEKAIALSPGKRMQNWATPRGTLELLRALQQGSSLSQASRSLLLQFMADSRTGPQRIKGLLPPGTVVSHKTGSSGTTNGVTHAINDVGIVNLPNGKHLAIAVFVADSRAGEGACERVIAEMARAAWDHSVGR